MGVDVMDIEHISEVLPHIEGRPEFVLVNHGEYQSIDYCYVDEGSFDDPVRLECRGIKFDKQGYLIAHPLHKFFNVGERPDTMPDTVDLSKPHVITEKLDGSMIHPAMVGDDIRMMTRRGLTETAVDAERLMTPDVEAFCAKCITFGYTPIFEYTGPQNRIVVRYEKPALTLLAIRANFSGDYVPHDRVIAQAEQFGIDVVGRHSKGFETAVEFIEYVRDLQGVEGFVVRFDCGRTVKLKCVEYVTKHRAKDSIASEKNVLAIILAGLLDDMTPLLDPADWDAVSTYADSVNRGATQTAREIASLVKRGDGLTQKEFAVDHLKDCDQHTRALAFTMRAGTEPYQAVRDLIAKNLRNRDRLESVRPLFNATYTHVVALGEA